MLNTRQKWTLTQDAFDKLLIAFGGDRESGSEKYLEIRGNLTRFFEWRGCPFPEDHADETMNRVAKKVERVRADDLDVLESVALDVPAQRLAGLLGDLHRRDPRRPRRQLQREPAQVREAVQRLAARVGRRALMVLALVEEGAGLLAGLHVR